MNRQLIVSICYINLGETQFEKAISWSSSKTFTLRFTSSHRNNSRLPSEVVSLRLSRGKGYSAKPEKETTALWLFSIPPPLTAKEQKEHTQLELNFLNGLKQY